MSLPQLWKLILAGSDRRPQGFNGLITKDDTGNLVTCAIGAAEEAAGYTIYYNKLAGPSLEPPNREVNLELKELLRRKASTRCQLCGARRFHDLQSLIVHLNDKHKTSREAIALKYVKPLEDAYEDQQ